jgi:transcriptional regulator with XRE-family HTH domain
MQISLDFVAGALRVAMERQGIKTQRELADLFGVTYPVISAWLNPKRRQDLPGDEMLAKIAELSGYDKNRLMLCKRLLKWQDEGVDIESLKDSVISLSDDQAAVVDLMARGEYVAAAQFLLSNAKLSA